jgi:hypothetical protein
MNTNIAVELAALDAGVSPAAIAWLAGGGADERDEIARLTADLGGVISDAELLCAATQIALKYRHP